MASSALSLILKRFLSPFALVGALWVAAPALAQEAPRDGVAAEQEPQAESEPAATSEDLPVEIPADDPPALRIPEALGSEPPSTGDEPIPEEIRDALQGREGQGQTGDAILDGVLDAIRRRGSVLDGSSLDPRADDQSPLPQPELRPLPREGRPRGRRHPSAPRSLARRAVDAEARFLLAEQLLKTARLLVAHGEDDPAGRQLVADLRDEATRLLAAPPRPRSNDRRSDDPGSEQEPAPAGYDEPIGPY